MAVKRRPLFHEKTDELEALVQRAIAKGDLRMLKSVRRELTFRSTKRARTLAVRVQEAVEKIEAAMRRAGAGIFPADDRPVQQLLFFPSFSERSYQDAKPHLIRAWGHAILGGYNLKEFYDDLLSRYGEPIAPFAMRFVQDVREDNLDI